MRLIPRSRTRPAALRAAAPRLAGALLAASLVALAFASAPAGAFISGSFGLQQRRPVWVRHGPLQYHHGPVIHASEAYAIYWDPLELYDSEWMRLIDQYFQNVGSAAGGLGNVFALNAQYGETGYSTQPSASAAAQEAHAANRSTFRGAYTDTDSYPPLGEECAEAAEIACLTDQNIKAELQKVIKSGALPGATGTVPGAKSTPVYYILTPPGVTVCAEASSPGTCSNSAVLEQEVAEIKEQEIKHPAEAGICGYHSTINPGGPSPIVYAVQPWIAGDAGLYIESVSPLQTSDTSADVLACQDDKSLKEPNQLGGLNPFAAYGAGLADVIINDLADEQTNIVVDPLLNGWYQNAPAVEQGSPEQGDMCLLNFGIGKSSAGSEGTHAENVSNEEMGSGSYYLHWAFNSSGFLTGKNTAGCWQGVTLEPHITAPNPVNVGDVVGLDANESGITLDPAPLGPRQAKEEIRLAQEVAFIESEEAKLGEEIAKLGEAEGSTLPNEIAALGLAIVSLEAEVAAFGEEVKALGEEEVNTREERRQAEKSGITSTEEKEFEDKEKRLASKRQNAEQAKVTAENKIKADEERIVVDEKAIRADKERKVALEADELIVVADKALAKEEKKLAEEHKLIKENEPFPAPIYKWDFGYQANGKEVTEEGEEKASVFHAFPCAGTYTVGLTVVDGGGYQASLPQDVTKAIVVEGKSCEEAPSGGSPGAGAPTGVVSGGASGGAGGVSTSGTGAKPPVPGPLATQTILSRSLTQTLSKGLLVRYSVNQQAAGHFEVLLAASTARRIGLHGPLAQGLPQGTPPQMVIAKALLVTTKAGRNTLKIQFGKITAKRLRRLHKVSLTLRLTLRNAGGGTTTVLSALTLH